MSPKPMLTEDYLIRQINLGLATLARIIGLKTAGHYQEALIEIDQLLEELIGLRSYMIKNLTDEGVLAILSHPNGLDTDRLMLIANLIKHEGDIYASKNYIEDTNSNYMRALNFYLEVQLSGGSQYFPPPHQQIEELLERFNISELPAGTLYNLFSYYEQAGEFAKSEGMLDAVLEAVDLSEEMVAEYEEFYTRLLEKTDQELEYGGLSRSQIEKKLNQLHPRFDGLNGSYGSKR